MRGAKVSLLAIVLVTASLAGCFGNDGDNEEPIAEAGIDVEVEVGEEVIFSGTGLDNDGSVVMFWWDFEGDGEWDWSGEIGSRIHVYDRPGDYLAVLRVEDDEGARSTDSRWVNVTASVHITVDWASSSTFVVHVSASLDVDDMEVDWVLNGESPTPVTRTFTHDAGIVKVNNTTYTVSPTVVLEGGQRHLVKVRLGEVVIARRSIEVVDASDASGAYDAVYTSTLWDARTYGGNVTELWRNGTLSVESRIGWSRGEFNGTGSWYTYTNRSGVITEQWVTLDDVVARMDLGTDFGQTWWSHSGHGDMNQSSEAGFYVFAYVWDFLHEMDNGSLVHDDWRRVGRYTDSGDPNNTTGTFEWLRTTQGNMVFQNGEGDLYEVLKITSERTYEGTNRGQEFYLHNLSMEFDASRLIFDNRTIYIEGTQEFGMANDSGTWRWQNTTFSEYLDEGGDQVYNPDPLDYDPELGVRISGPRPRVLVVGDAFTATNFYGVALTYVAKRADTGPMDTPTGPVNVTGVLAEAISNTTWGNMLHWFWVLEDGPLPGLVFEERVSVARQVYGGGTYDLYRNIRSVNPLT